MMTWASHVWTDDVALRTSEPRLHVWEMTWHYTRVSQKRTCEAKSRPGTCGRGTSHVRQVPGTLQSRQKQVPRGNCAVQQSTVYPLSLPCPSEKDRDRKDKQERKVRYHRLLRKQERSWLRQGLVVLVLVAATGPQLRYSRLDCSQSTTGR